MTTIPLQPEGLRGKKVWRMDRQTDGRTDWTSHIAAWSQLKTIGHLFYATSSFVHHFVAIGEFKLQLQSGNTRFGSNSTIFIEPCDLEIWGMTLKNNTPPLLCYFKLCASFLSHWWNLTDDLKQGKSEGFDSCDRPSNLTQIGFKSSIFQPVWPWNLMDDPKKQ